MTILRADGKDLERIDAGGRNELEAYIHDNKIEELAFIDTNVLVAGAFPEIDRGRIQMRVYLDHKFGGTPVKSWKEYVKFERGIVNWMRNWHAMKKPVAPVITGGVEYEFHSVCGRRRHDSMSSVKFLLDLQYSSTAFYIALAAAGTLPEDIRKEIAQYTKEGQRRDRKLLGVAYEVLGATYAKVCVVSGDSDFNQMVKGVFSEYGEEDGRYLTFETPAEFSKRIQIPTPQMFSEKKRRYGR